MPDEGEPNLPTGRNQETRELPFIEEKQLVQGREFWSRLIGG